MPLKRVLTILAAMLLVGCAATRPALPDSAYAPTVKQWSWVNYCGSKGLIPVDVAGAGKGAIERYLVKYSVDGARLESERRVFTTTTPAPTQEQCNQLAMDISAQQQRVNKQRQDSYAIQQQDQALINSNRSVNTYCNRIGTQTFCNSY